MSPRREWPASARVALLVGSACILFLALTQVATRDDAYAPNDWLFSHSFLAQKAIEHERIPLNRDLFTEHKFEATVDDFQSEVGLERMTFYANTVWHFWNGLPLQPALLATLATLTGEEVEDAARAPIAGLLLVLLAAASAELVARTSAAWLAPFALAACSAPLVLDLRVLMPSTSLLVIGLLVHLLLRRQVERDGRALAVAMVPLALLPFWYYTVSYFVILLFGGFVIANLIQRRRAPEAPPVVPLLLAAIVPLALAAALLLNGALTSHLEMAGSMGSLSVLGGESSGGDYKGHLNREAWRSAVLYVALALFFLPLGLVGLQGLRRQRAAAPEAVFAHWGLGALAFSVALPGAAGVSFLNRSVIYLTPLAAVALAYAASRSRAASRVAGVALAVGLVATPVLVATAAPSYSAGDAEAFAWMEAHVPQDAVVYSSLDASSVLFRAHGYFETLAFHPRTRLLEDFWYGTDPQKMVPYLASVEWVVMRDDVASMGFEEFGPLREPISAEAFAKFDASPDLHRVFDNGEVRVYAVALSAQRLRSFGDG